MVTVPPRIAVKPIGISRRDIGRFEETMSASSPPLGMPAMKAFHSSGMSSRSSITRCARATTRRQVASPSVDWTGVSESVSIRARIEGS